MRSVRLFVVGAFSALLLLPVGVAAGSAPDAASADAGPAAAFSATITTKAWTKARSTGVAVKAQNVPSGQSVTGFFLSENAAANPTLSASGWKTQPTTFTLSDADGAKTVYVWARTKSSISARGSATTFLDRGLPTVSGFDVTPTTATTATVALTFSSTDPGAAAASGIVKYAVVNGVTPPSSSATAWKDVAPTSIKLSKGNGPKTVSAFVRDRAGNVSAAASDTVTLAIPGPSLTFSMPQYTRTQSVSVDLEATDGASVGIAGYLLKETSSTPTAGAAGWKLQPSTFALSAGEGSKTVYAWVKDNNGTISAVQSDTTLWDKTAPTASLTITTASPTSTKTIDVTASGNAGGGSPIVEYAIVNGTTAPTLGSEWKSSPPTTFVLSNGTGVKQVSLFVKDAAGNISAANTKSITLATAPPTVIINLTKANSSSLTVPVAVTTTDPSGTGIKGYFLSTTNSTPAANAPGWKFVTTSFTFTGGDGVKTLYGWVKDGTGAVSAASSDTVRIDTVVPVVTITVTNNNSASASVAITSATDTSGSGIVGYALVIGTSAPSVTDDAAWSATMVGATVTLSNGNQTVTGFAKDAAGNVSVVTSNSSKSVTKS